MERPAIKRKIDLLNIDINWLKYNLDFVNGLGHKLIKLDYNRRKAIYGKRTYEKLYSNNGVGFSSPFDKSINYLIESEQYILNKMKDATDQLKIAEGMNKKSV